MCAPSCCEHTAPYAETHTCITTHASSPPQPTHRREKLHHVLPLQAAPLRPLRKAVAQFRPEGLPPLLQGGHCLEQYPVHLVHKGGKHLVSTVQALGDGGSHGVDVGREVLVGGLDVWPHDVADRVHERCNAVADDGVVVRDMRHDVGAQLRVLWLLQKDVCPQHGTEQGEQEGGEEQAGRLLAGWGGRAGGWWTCSCTDACGLCCRCVGLHGWCV